jgi:TOBE domain
LQQEIANEAQRPQPAQRQDRRGDQGPDDSPCPHRYRQRVIVTSSITNEAVDELGLAVGDEAIAVIKASDVMVAK